MPINQVVLGFACAASVFVSSAAMSQVFVEVPFDESMSEIEVTLSLNGESDTDTSPISGSVTIDLDDPSMPMQFTLSDLRLNATESIDHSISFSIFGAFTQSTTGLMVSYAMPGTPTAPVPIVAGGYTIPTLDTTVAGLGAYNATGIVCTLVQNAGLNCNDTIDFAQLGTITAQDIAGAIDVANGVITISAMLDIEAPLDPKNPGLGTVRVVGLAVGSENLPDPLCPGDCDETGSVDFADLVAMLFEFGGPGIAGCDADGSGVVNFADLVSALFLFGDCP